MKESNYIGFLHSNIFHEELVTIGDLKEYLAKGNTVYKANQYCDWRYSTSLTRFVFDPYTGEKINWKEVRKLLET